MINKRILCPSLFPCPNSGCSVSGELSIPSSPPLYSTVLFFSPFLLFLLILASLCPRRTSSRESSSQIILLLLVSELIHWHSGLCRFFLCSYPHWPHRGSVLTILLLDPHSKPPLLPNMNASSAISRLGISPFTCEDPDNWVLSVVRWSELGLWV